MRNYKGNIGIVAPKQIKILVLSGLMLLESVFAVYAEEGVAGPSGKNYRTEYWETLTDNILEYNELEDRIHEFNTNFNSTWETMADSKQSAQRYAEEMESARFKIKNLESTAKEKQKQGDNTVAGNLYIYDMILNGGEMPLPTGKTYRMPGFGSWMEGYYEDSNSSLEELIPTKNRIMLKNGEKQTLQGAQQLMINYDSLAKQQKIMQLMTEMYDLQYQAVLNRSQLGMATEQEVLQAKTNQLMAAENTEKIKGLLLQLKPNLCTLTGYSADAPVEIMEIPPVDIGEVDQIDLEEGIRKAVGSNLTLVEARNSAKAKTSSGIDARLKYLEEGEEKVKIKMQEVYSNVLSAKTAYLAVLDGYQAARKEREKNQRMKEMGYLSPSDFAGLELLYYRKEAEFHSADTALRNALATYYWATRGLLSVD